jgi:hypothetical protein
MARIEAENGYLEIDLEPGETIAKTQDDAGNTEITFDSAKDAEEAMDMLAEVLCDKWLADDSEMIS